MAVETLLIVDDSELARAMLSEIFRDSFTILEAESGEEALEIIREFKGQIGVVLLDITMPGMDGIEMLTLMKHEAPVCDAAVVMITASNNTADQLKAFNAGADDYITKPFDAPIVRARVNNIVKARLRLKTILTEREHFRNCAQIDQMTNLLNKTSTEKYILEALEDESRGTLSALMMIDVDYFKQVNDTEGHIIGDHTIRIIADLLSSRFKKEDIVGRVGGDEFLIYMKDIPCKDIARAKAEDLVRLLKYKPNISLPANVSVSIGLAFIEGPCSYESALMKADSALYTAKTRGKARMSEHGIEVREAEATDLPTVCLVTRSLAVHNVMARALAGKASLVESNVIRDLEEQIRNLGRKVDAVFLDASAVVGEELEERWRMFDSVKMLQEIPRFVLFAEGNLKQIEQNIRHDLADIISVPVDVEALDRKIAKWIGSGA